MVEEGNSNLQTVYSEAEVAAAIASVLDPEWESEGDTRENVIRELLLHLPDPPEPEAATSAARFVLIGAAMDEGQNEEHGQS